MWKYLAYVCLAGSMGLTWGWLLSFINETMGIYIGLVLFVGGLDLLLQTDKRYEREEG